MNTGAQVIFWLVVIAMLEASAIVIGIHINKLRRQRRD